MQRNRSYAVKWQLGEARCNSKSLLPIRGITLKTDGSEDVSNKGSKGLYEGSKHDLQDVVR